MIDELNYNYYGIPTGRYIYADWDNTLHVGDLVNDNMYNLYQENGTPIADRWGKPLDNSVYLWHIKPDCSFARNRAFCADIGNTLHIETPEHIETEPVPLTVSCVDRYTNPYGGFNTAPHYRLANNNTKAEGFMYNPLAYNIPYTSYCIHAQAGCFNRANKAFLGRDFSQIAAWIDVDPDNRDVWYIAPTLYVGTTTDRRNTDFRASETDKIGAILPDILTYRPIPSNAEHVIHEILDGQPEGAVWDTTKVYNPFSQSIGQNNFWRGGNLVSTYNYQMRIGLQQYLLYSQIRAGYVDYSTISPPSKTTGQFFRASSAIQYYDDVAFKWSFKVYDINSGLFIENGYPISGLSSGCRLCTVLEIVDYKGATKGEALTRACMHEIAAIGFYFTDAATNAQSYELGSNGSYSGVYLPEIIGGVTTGNYVTGDAVKDVPYFNATDVSDFKYEPDDVYNDSTPSLNDSIVTAESVHMYAQVPITVLIENLNAIPSVDPDDQTLDINKFFFGADPYDFILGYYITPKFFIPQWYITEYRGHPDTVYLGKYICDNRYGAPAPICYTATLKTPLRRLFIKDVYIKRLFNNFLDYEPYSSLSLYLPFMGTVELPPSIFVGNTLSVYSSYDLISGMVTYMIYAGVTQYVTKSALARIDMPFHGRDISDYSRNMLSAYTERNVTMFNMISSLGSTVGRAGTAASISSNKLNPEGMISSGLGGVGSILGSIGSSLATANMYDTILMKSSPNPSTISMGSIADGFANTLTPYIIRTVPEYASGFKTEKYGKINGFACYHNDTISNYHGFTVIENPILDDIPISQAEKELLRTLLHKGVILP